MIGAQIQKAVYDALVATGVAGGRVYDAPPASPIFPYVTIGDENVIDDLNSCAELYEVYVDVHVWSRPPSGSRAEAKTLGAEVAAALDHELPVADFNTVLGHLQTARYFRDPDNITVHGVITFKYLIDPE